MSTTTYENQAKEKLAADAATSAAALNSICARLVNRIFGSFCAEPLEDPAVIQATLADPDLAKFHSVRLPHGDLSCVKLTAEGLGTVFIRLVRPAEQTSDGLHRYAWSVDPGLPD